ncbi:MAG: transposase, partial [Cyclobacteriaceae bacterium]|nr:transposase [Cyclobacteriaceae bacterium]
RIVCKSPDGKEYNLFTSVLDKNIDKGDIQMLYLSRWDIEVSIREIKTIMDINILRSKTPEMLEKELNVSLTAYNLIRKMIYASLKDLPFPPKEDFIYKFYTYVSAITLASGEKQRGVFDSV